MPISPDQYIEDVDRLVSLPDACARILSLAQNPATSSLDLVEAVASDPEMAAQTLRIANSAYYGFPMRIDTLSRAISVIGTRELQDLALSYGVINAFNHVDTDILNFQQFWQHSVLTGFLARKLSSRTAVKIIHKERMFLAGLLHDVGMLVMLAKTPEIMRIIIHRANEGKEPFRDVEKLVFGLSHDDIGAAIMKRWNFPESIQAVAKYHHTPEQAPDYLLEVCVVHIATVLASVMKHPVFDNNVLTKVSGKAWEITGMNKEVAQAVIQEVKQEYNDAISAFLPHRSAANF